MGKSPGKWIKSVLFGKKSSKSNLPKEVTGEKRSAAKASLEDLALNPPIQNFDRGSENTELEKGTSTVISCDSADLSSVTQDVESQVTKVAISADDAGLKRLEQAATKAQAAFRGYLARQAFLALKGIIKLQALIRGHLVRRQAVATLHCMQAIVRVQALARGQKTRLSDPAHQVLKKYTSGGFQDAKQVDLSIVNKSVRPEKLTASAFVCKVLLTFSPSDETKQKEFLCIISKFPSNPEFLCIISKCPSNPEFLCIISNFYALRSTREENKSLNDRLSTLEKEMK